MEYTIINGELLHYGVKGMKWGVRREARVATSVATHAMLAIAISKGGSMARKALKNVGDKRLKHIGSLVNIGAKAASASLIVTGALKVKEIAQNDE